MKLKAEGSPFTSQKINGLPSPDTPSEAGPRRRWGDHEFRLLIFHPLVSFFDTYPSFAASSCNLCHSFILSTFALSHE